MASASSPRIDPRCDQVAFIPVGHKTYSDSGPSALRGAWRSQPNRIAAEAVSDASAGAGAPFGEEDRQARRALGRTAGRSDQGRVRQRPADVRPPIPRMAGKDAAIMSTILADIID